MGESFGGRLGGHATGLVVGRLILASELGPTFEGVCWLVCFFFSATEEKSYLISSVLLTFFHIIL